MSITAGACRDTVNSIDTPTFLPDGLALLAEENSAFIDNALDLMVVHDTDGRILRVNAAARPLLGYAPEEMVGRHFTDLVHAEHHSKALGVVASLRQDHMARTEVALRIRRKDGRVILMSASARWSATHGRMFVTARDITGQYAARQALQRSEAALNSMLESIGDAFFAVDSAWRLTYANRKAGDFVAVDAAKVIGLPLLEVAPDLLHTPTLAHYQRAMETRQPDNFETFWEPRQVWLDVRVYPMEDGISVYFHEITARRDAELALRKSEQRFRKLFNQAGDSVMILDAALRIVSVNDQACARFGYGREEFIGMPVADVNPGYPGGQALLARLRAGHAQLLHLEKRCKDGSSFPAEVQVSRFDDEGEEFFLAVIRDISARKEAERRLEQLATHDSLTGLPNRALLGERVQQMLDSAPHGSSVAVMFLDLDRFKEVNDSFGHEMGDVLLCEVAARLRRVIRPTDIIARLGGDEFVVAAHCPTGRPAASRIADKLLDVLTAPVSVGGSDVIVGASIGISMYPQDAQTRELLFQTADTAMYRAKSAGRNRYRFFEPEMTVATQVRMALEVSLRPALARGEFELHYQPRYALDKASLGGLTLYGMEALIRWNHPERGRVPPQQFIGIAEETGLINAIGRWVLEEACSRTRCMMAEYGRKLVVSVNVSARQLAQAGFADEVRAILARTGLTADCLELELTESALIEDIERTASMLRELKGLGIRIAVDDFGTGYSGLAYLRRFPIDVLKLDRSFVMEQDGNVTTFDFVKAFVDLAHALGMAVVAEGVETEEVLHFLRAARCDQAQGYYLARPMPLDGLCALLADEPAPGR